LILERRPVHIYLTKDVFLNFKIKCADDRMTMQEVVEFFVSGLVDDRKEMVSLYEELIQLKKDKKVNRVARVEVDKIFDKILEESEDEAI
jgi:hypothetical protein